LTEVGSRVRETLDALLAGYTMSLTRLDALVQLAGLEPFDYTGQPFDPETMEVLELVVGTEFADGQVLEVVRRGYRRAGRIYRYSQVRVARRTPRG